MAFWTGLVPGIGRVWKSAPLGVAFEGTGATDFPFAGAHRRQYKQAASDYQAIVGDSSREAPMENARGHFLIY